MENRYSKQMLIIHRNSIIMEKQTKSPRNINVAIQRRSARLKKHIPTEVLGLKVAEPGPGMEGTLNWLKVVHLHKYWAFFCQFNYYALITLKDEDDLDFWILSFECEPLPTGTRKKILMELDHLHARGGIIRSLNPYDLITCCKVISYVLMMTPLSKFPENDGSFLFLIIRDKLREIKNAVKATKTRLWPLVKNLMNTYRRSYAASIDDQMLGEQWIAEVEQHLRAWRIQSFTAAQLPGVINYSRNDLYPEFKKHYKLFIEHTSGS